VADVTPLGNGRYLVSDGSRQRLAYATGPPDARWVFLDGRVYVIEVTPRTAASRVRGTHDEMALAAPMPATVATLNVRPGQQVAAGDELIVLEAMKMEWPIRAPRAGRVKAVACRQGELVQPGVPLLELE
jgi:3-methylcrotonyl-CoA carboxylase alpha subunit